MTQPYTPIFRPSSVPQQQLRPAEHPNMSDILTHFCSRGRPDGQAVSPDILAMNPQQRLESILWGHSIRAFVTYSYGLPAVCFTESRIDGGLPFLIGQRGYQPWGLMFERQKVFDAGGGPVWYARPEEYDVLGHLLDWDPRLRSRAVRLGGGSDWLEEREWRILCPPQRNTIPAVSLAQLPIYAVLVGDPTWTGTRPALNHEEDEWMPCFPPWLAGVPRACWNPTKGGFDWYPPFYVMP